MNRVLLIGLAALLGAAKPCDVREKELYVEALTARGGVALWQAESDLIKHRRPSDCREPATPKTGTTPSRLNLEVDLPKQPQGVGTGPWVFIGIGMALGGGALVVDALANGTRDDLERTQASGDREGFDSARNDFVTQRWIARGLVAGGAVAGLIGVLWLSLGGESSAVQTRPVFGPASAGLEVSF